MWLREKSGFLQSRRQKIKKYYPFEESHFPLANADDVAYLDMFTTRFAKLQDSTGEKVFPVVWDVLDNTHDVVPDPHQEFLIYQVVRQEGIQIA